MGYRSQLCDMAFDYTHGLGDIPKEDVSKLAHAVEYVGEDADETIGQLVEALDGLVRDMKEIKPASHVGIQMAERALQNARAKLEQ